MYGLRNWKTIANHFKLLIQNIYTANRCVNQHISSMEKYTNCLYTTPQLVNQTIVLHSPSKILYSPVNYPARYL